MPIPHQFYDNSTHRYFDQHHKLYSNLFSHLRPRVQCSLGYVCWHSLRSNGTCYTMTFVFHCPSSFSYPCSSQHMQLLFQNPRHPFSLAWESHASRIRIYIYTCGKTVFYKGQRRWPTLQSTSQKGGWHSSPDVGWAATQAYTSYSGYSGYFCNSRCSQRPSRACKFSNVFLGYHVAGWSWYLYIQPSACVQRVPVSSRPRLQWRMIVNLVFPGTNGISCCNQVTIPDPPSPRSKQYSHCSLVPNPHLN